MVEPIEGIAHLRHHYAPVFLHAVTCIPQYVELHIKQFLKLQSHLRPSQMLCRHREMDVPHRLVIAHQFVSLHHIRRQSLLQRRAKQLEHVGSQLRHSLRSESALLHPLRRVIGRTQSRSKRVGYTVSGRFPAPVAHGQFHIIVILKQHLLHTTHTAHGIYTLHILRPHHLYFRMSHIDSAIKHRRLTEHYIRLAAVIAVGNIFNALKPHQVNDARPV